jgi:predicted dehydrogenase
MVNREDPVVTQKIFKDLGVFIVGCGSIGRRHTEVLKSLGIKDIRIYDNDFKKMESLSAEFPDLKTCNTFEDGLKEKPDAVFILTPTKLHLEMIKKSVQNGCHVFSEKPISDSIEGIDELIDISRKAKVKVMVGHCFRFHEGLLNVKKILDSGKIGRLVSIKALMGENLPTIRPDYKTLYLSKYSGVFELIHDIDLAIWYANKPVEKIKAIYGNYSDIGIEAPDVAEINIGFADKCIASIHIDFFQIPRRRYLELMGTDDTIIIEFGSWDKYTISIFEKEKNCWSDIEGNTKRNDMFRDEDFNFLDAIINDKSVSPDIAEAMKVVEVLEVIKNDK